MANQQLWVAMHNKYVEYVKNNITFKDNYYLPRFLLQCWLLYWYWVESLLLSHLRLSWDGSLTKYQNEGALSEHISWKNVIADN